MQAGTHPDYYALSPEKGKSALGIDAVRDVNEKLYEHARLGGAKVVWISDAALLTDAAANALLKTLEEPRRIPVLPRLRGAGASADHSAQPLSPASSGAAV